MLQRFLKCISTMLILVMLFNMVPVQALELLPTEAPASEPAQTTEEGKILAELSNQRDTYTKQFLLDNGTKMAVQYTIPVHYQDGNGTWQQYDNRMTQTEDAAAAEPEYRVIQSDKDIRLSKKASEKKLVTIEKDGHQISWGFTGINKVDVVFTQDDTVYEGNDAYLTLLGIVQEARYDDAFPNADLQYYILPTGVKENIILKNTDAQNEFLLEYKFHKLTASQTDSRHITLSDEEGNPVYTITAPAMCDANGVWSNALTLTIVESKENKLTVKLTADTQWLQNEDRAFPVTVDPTFEAALFLNSGSISTTTIVSGHPNSAYGLGGDSYIGSLYAGYETDSTFRKTRTLVKISNLPELSPGDVIVDAQIALREQASSGSIQVNAHRATADWESATATWNSMNANYHPLVEDYNLTYSGMSGLFNSWNITDLVKKWYDGTVENYGIMLIAPTETSTTRSRVIYYSVDYPGPFGTMPVFSITFRNHNGLESYWDYTPSSAGRAGTGYVNSYTGNLVWTRTDMGFGGNLGAVAIEHIYNTNNANEDLYGFGYGWRTNFNQRIYTWSQDSNCYIWEDGDGTEHYFKRVTSGIYRDEDNPGLKLQINSGTNDRFAIVNQTGLNICFDINGRLTMIFDDQEDDAVIEVFYTTADGTQIERIEDGVGRVYAFTYTDGLLSRLAFKGTGETELAHTVFGYTNGLLTSITDKDNKTVTYTYDPNHKHLLEAKDIDGYKITYQYDQLTAGQPSRVIKVQEYDGTTSGGKLDITYGNNETTFVDLLGNQQTLHFDNRGNTTSVQDDQGRAQFGTYHRTDSGEKSNQLKLSSKMQNTVVNLLPDSSFENGTAWTTSTGGTTEVSSQHAYFGTKALYINNTEQTTLGGGSYTVAAGKSATFSGWVKTVSGTAKLGLSVNNSVRYSTELSNTTDWTRLQITYTNNGTQAVTVQPLFCGTGEAYLDGVQLELQPTASRYNLVNNGDFQQNTNWTPSNTETGDGITTLSTPAPTLDNRVYLLHGNGLEEKNISQEIQLSGTAGDSFVLGGWGMGDAVPIPEDSDRAFGLYAIFHYTDDTDSERISVNFNPDAGSWQYAATGLAAEKDYSSLTIYACYDHGANTVYFDGIQLFKEEFGTTYTYDDDGNVISVLDLQNKNTEYTYSNGNLIQVKQDNKIKMTYVYDGYHNVTKATTEEGYVYEYDYDAFGNNISVSFTENSNSSAKKTITTSATYSSTGNYIATETDALGNVTRYGYNEQTGLLDWVQFPEDSEATRTDYTYDAMYRTASVTANLYNGTADTNMDMSVSYTYEDDLLTSIITPYTTYNFTYTDFSLRSSVKIGARTIASYTYEEDTHWLKKLDYGNGDKVQYTYDKQGRVTVQSYEDGARIKYQYDNSGNLANVTDTETGVVTTFFYDLLNRDAGYREQGPNLDHSVSYTYDDKNHLASMTEVINGVTKTYSYTYDEENDRLTSMTVDGVTVAYTYDSFGRLATQTTKQGETVILTEQPGYNDTDATASNQIVSYNGFTYTYDDNGNILSISDGTHTTTYAYDSQNQLIRELNEAQQVAYVWEYDNAGNIMSRKEYLYVNNRPVRCTDTVSYSYHNLQWGDLLTAYDGTSISYDAIGNPHSDGQWTYTWKHGRELVSMSDGTTTWNYTYNADGLRTKRTSGANTYTYVYSGSQLATMTVGENTMHFTYDASGAPLAVKYNGTTYYYKTNLQGDIIAILDSTGAAVVTYAYNAWGVLLNTSGAMKDTLGTINPLTYRSYVYDRETGLYYLQSRYYNPEMGRFINGDNQISDVGGEVLGYNMFAYCMNNPVNNSDPTGNWPSFKKIITGISKVVNWLSNTFVKPTVNAVKRIINEVSSDIENFDAENTSEEKVLDANYFSVYNGTPVIKAPIGDNAFTYGVMVIGDGVTDTPSVQHEYGHSVQFQQLGLHKFTLYVGVPSLVGYYGGVKYENYYSLPWEYGADLFGKVERDQYEYSDKAERNFKIYWGIINLFP